MEMAYQREDHTEDTLIFLICCERDIISGDCPLESQLVAAVNGSNPVDPVVPSARNLETDKALEPSPEFSWYRYVVEQESALIEQVCSEEQEERLVVTIHISLRLLDLSVRKTQSRRLSSGLIILSQALYSGNCPGSRA